MIVSVSLHLDWILAETRAEMARVKARGTDVGQLKSNPKSSKKYTQVKITSCFNFSLSQHAGSCNAHSSYPLSRSYEFETNWLLALWWTHWHTLARDSHIMTWDWHIQTRDRCTSTRDWHTDMKTDTYWHETDTHWAQDWHTLMWDWHTLTWDWLRLTQNDTLARDWQTLTQATFSLKNISESKH